VKLGTVKAKALCAAEGWEWQDKWLGLELKPIKRKRSVEANARYWVIVTALGDEVGMSKAEMHNEVLSEFHGYELVEFRGSIVKKPKGRSHNLPSETFTGLMFIAEKWAADMQVRWGHVE